MRDLAPDRWPRFGDSSSTPANPGSAPRASPPRLTQLTGCHRISSNQRVATEEAGMGFPDRIERTVEIARPPTAVWAALTTAEGLGTWFGNSATINLRPGGTAQIAWSSGDKADLRIERVEEPAVFGFTWHIYGLPDDDPRRTYVEFALETVGAGTRLTVAESGFAQLPDDAHGKSFGGNVDGWGRELGELAEYLAAA